MSFSARVLFDLLADCDGSPQLKMTGCWTEVLDRVGCLWLKEGDFGLGEVTGFGGVCLGGGRGRMGRVVEIFLFRTKHQKIEMKNYIFSTKYFPWKTFSVENIFFHTKHTLSLMLA